MSILLGVGDGSFHSRNDYPTGRRPFSVAVGDLDGDGDPDLATADYDDGTVSVLRRAGDPVGAISPGAADFGQ